MSPVRRAIAVISLLLAAAQLQAQENGDYWITQAVVQAKVPKKLRTFSPFWGVPKPLSGEKETTITADTYVYARKDSTSIPDWLCWNLDLVSTGDSRYKFEEQLPDGYRPSSMELIRKVVDECYRWAWRKPYGTSCVVMGPLYYKENPLPYAWYVAVCKKEVSTKTLALGFSSIAFIVPELPSARNNIYSCSESVNIVEYKSGYNLFPKLPESVQEQVEEITTYELFCPFQEVEENLIEMLEVEFEENYEMIEQG